jgi:glycosyltransferase involved in cell wall biosynthesis
MSIIEIIGIANGSYPFGTANTIRTMTLLEGLKELSCNVSLISLYPDKNQDPNSDTLEGIYREIPFKYLSDSLLFNHSKITRTLDLLRNSLKLIKHLNNASKNNKIVVFNFLPQPFLITFITLFLKRKQIILFHEVTEYPFIRTNYNKLINTIYSRFIIPLHDRLFVINKALKKYFAEYIKESKITILNMFVDPKPFAISYKKPFNFEYIAYCGSMNTDKDGVPLLIDSFSAILKKYPKLKLVLIGDNKKRPVHPKIKNVINKYNLNDKIVFTGHVNHRELPNYLCNAKVLSLARPDNIQAKGGFPTKLGEYLATKVPVVVTNVGEIPLFLKNNKNAFLSLPNKKDFSSAILRVLDDYDQALAIAQEGYKLVETEFNYRHEAQKVLDIISNILENK